MSRFLYPNGPTGGLCDFVNSFFPAHAVIEVRFANCRFVRKSPELIFDDADEVAFFHFTQFWPYVPVSNNALINHFMVHLCKVLLPHSRDVEWGVARALVLLFVVSFDKR